MENISETEINTSEQIAAIMEALPMMRRWLDRSMPPKQSRQAQSSPLSLSQVRMLIHIYQYGPQTMGELARIAGISCSTATECVNGLVARGRAVSSRAADDRRKVVVGLTPAAEAVVSYILERRSAIVQKVLEQLSPSESSAFLKGMRLLSHEAKVWLDQTALVSESGSTDAAKEASSVS